MVRVADSVDEIVELYRRWGTDHYDEDVSQLAHAVQTAALAGRDGADEELVVAALLHDVGHLLELEFEADSQATDQRAADLNHEARGAQYLSALFPAAVTAPVALHVRAKRYRCAVDPEYHDRLSAGSKRSLELQGGPMSSSEVISFEANPGFEAAVQLRGWDDGGKVDGLAVPAFDSYLQMIERVVI